MQNKVVVSGAKDEVAVSKTDPCGICGKRVMANSVLCVKCKKWILERRAKVKGGTLRLGRDFVCGRCKKQADGFMDSVEELSEEVETVRGFCYLGDRLNAGGGCDAAVTARARIARVKFRECRELLNSKRFSLKLKGMVYWSCVRSAMLQRTEDLMEMLGLKETAVQMAKANGVRLYGYVLRRDDGHILRNALEFEVRGKRKRGRPN